MLTTVTHRKQNGFTIVELLIVIVVIAILATITFVAYNGIRERAQLATLQSDAANAVRTLEAYKFSGTNERYPADLTTANLKASDGTTYQYMVDNSSTAASYCLNATNGPNTILKTNSPSGTCAIAIAAPSITASSVSTSQINASWTTVPTAQSYTLQYSPNSAFSSSVTTVNNIAALTQGITALNAGTAYYLRVQSVNSFGTSAWAQTSQLTRTATPSGLSVFARTNYDSAKLSWTPVTGASSYDVQWANNSSFTSPSSTNVSGSSIPQLTSLSLNQSAFFRVRGVNSGGVGSWSTAVSPPDTLNAGSCISATFGVTDTSLRSQNGSYTAAAQGDGNLVVYSGTNVSQWQSNTVNGSGGSSLCMQTDGNLVLYNASNTPVWQTATSGSGNRAVIQNDGNFVVYRSNNTNAWSRF